MFFSFHFYRMKEEGFDYHAYTKIFQKLYQYLAQDNKMPTLSDCGMAKSSEPIKWQDSNTPTLTPYKAFSGALLL